MSQHSLLNFIGRRPWLTASAALGATALGVAACTGLATFATSITSNSATLNYTATCADNSTSNPCTGWAQYWQDGSATLTSTPQQVDNAVYTNFAWYQPITGLNAGALYHYQACGFGDTGQPSPGVAPPGVCLGTPGGNFLTAPGQELQPVAGYNGSYPIYDLSGFSSFRTANPGASPATSGTADLGRVISTADVSDYNAADNGPGATGNAISRDGGISVVYSTSPPKSIWLFGDTGYGCTNSASGQACVFQPGSTAASGGYTPGQAPTALTELPTPPAAIPATPPTKPAQLLKSVIPGDCTASYSAAWTGGGALIPSSTNVLMTFTDECVSVTNFIAQGFTLQPYTPSTNKLGIPVTPYLNVKGITPLEAFNSPIFGKDGYLYLYSATNGLAAPSYPNAVYVARVQANPTAWANKANYQWYSAAGWTTEAHATSVVAVPNNLLPVGVSVGDYSATASAKGYVIIMQTTFGDNSATGFTTFYGPSPSGPFTQGVSGQVPDGCLQHQPTAGFGCYALASHPELSSSSQLVFSYFASDDRLNDFTYAETGHIRLAAVAW